MERDNRGFADYFWLVATTILLASVFALGLLRLSADIRDSIEKHCVECRTENERCLT